MAILTFVCIGLLLPAVAYSSSCPVFSSDFSQATSGTFQTSAASTFSFALSSNCADDYEKCHDSCSENENNAYWSFQEQSSTGVCSCYDEDACNSESYSGPSTTSTIARFFSSSSSNQVVGYCHHGGVQGDPHFTGADNSRFDFSGTPGTTFCLVSDPHLHINMYLDGYYGKYEDRANKPMTWIRKIGVLWGHHSLTFEARPGAESEYLKGYMYRMTADGLPFALENNVKSLFDGKVEVEWTGAKVPSGDDLVDEYSVKIQNVIWMKLTVRPEVANLRTDNDGLVHFDMQILKAKLSNNVHGVLGQTFRPDHLGKFRRQHLIYSKIFHHDVVEGDNAEGFIDGMQADYVSSDILTADCKVTRFAREDNVDDETALGMELTGQADRRR
eukprot:TRINITY_DN1967_c0_g1_i2.p1 TRINITY_DN1967_c0_g1~~TRINITY_DN1967_c0_g1_i2.p1  ORF type:complete len:387 (+),score=41.22 TRINITY_DN1967_c0_g1_i2:46-1206(+)